MELHLARNWRNLFRNTLGNRQKPHQPEIKGSPRWQPISEDLMSDRAIRYLQTSASANAHFATPSAINLGCSSGFSQALNT
jgi:hypothetical protein